MPLGYLATTVATIPGWIEMVVNMDELDINPPVGPKFKPREGRPGVSCWSSSKVV